jgi:hypothetical protein
MFLPQRLSSLVQATKNPAILLYGIQTIGNDVDPDSVNWPLIMTLQALMTNRYVELTMTPLLRRRVSLGGGEFQLMVFFREIRRQRQMAQVELFLRQLHLQGTIIVAGKLKKLQDISRQSPEEVRQKLTHPEAETRWMAIQVMASKRYPMETDLIGRLGDRDNAVRQAARLALIRISRGNDFGPALKASNSEREKAISRWKQWWSLQDSHPRRQFLRLSERPKE